MNTYSPTYSDDDDEMGDIVEAYAEQEAADRPTVTDNARAEAQRHYQGDWDPEIDEPVDDYGFSDAERRAFVAGAEWAAAHTDEETRAAIERRRHLAEMTRQAFADGLYETSAADYAEALRRARAEPTTDIAEAAWEVIVRVRDDYPRVINDAPTEEIVEALADAGLLATARTATIEDAEEVLHGAGWFARADLDPRDLRGILHDLADAGLFATARAETITATVEDIADALEHWDRGIDWRLAEQENLTRAAYLRGAEQLMSLLATARTRPTREQIARALREGRTNGLCTLGVRCDLCDCAQDYEDDLALRDADAVLALYTYQPTRDDLARAIASGYEPDHPTPNRHDYRAADAVLALFNEKGD